VRVGLRVNQLNIDPHLISHFLHSTFKNVRYSKLLRDLSGILGIAVLVLSGRARNYF
jgi:hypothetical protein